MNDLLTMLSGHADGTGRTTPYKRVATVADGDPPYLWSGVLA
jgi:hypothetical protein